jgi:AraC-like DNA-binding protein
MQPKVAYCNDATRFARHAASGEAGRSNLVTSNVVFTTQRLSPSEQFEAYREFNAPVLDISPSEKSHLGFEASAEMWMLGRFVLRRITTPGGQFKRSARQVRHDGLDHWVFNLTRHGNQESHTATSTLRTGSNVLSVFSLAGAYEARRTHVEWVGLFVPRGLLPAVDAAFDHSQQLALDNPLGRIFGSYLIALVDELPSMRKVDLTHIIAAMQASLDACAASSPSAVLNSENACLDMPRMRLLRDMIDKNLGSWNLHAGRLCSLADISRSNLYRMFEPYGGVVHYIQRLRLRRAHDLLADPTCTRKINLIANDYCFSDLSSFSRAFRQEFGYSPSELRKQVERDGNMHGNNLPLRQASAVSGWGILYDT